MNRFSPHNGPRHDSVRTHRHHNAIRSILITAPRVQSDPSTINSRAPKLPSLPDLSSLQKLASLPAHTVCICTVQRTLVPGYGRVLPAASGSIPRSPLSRVPPFPSRQLFFPPSLSSLLTLLISPFLSPSSFFSPFLTSLIFFPFSSPPPTLPSPSLSSSRPS